MIGWRGILLGSFGLIVLYVVVQPAAAARLATLPGVAGNAARRFLSPSVPAIGATADVELDAAPAPAQSPRITLA